MIFDPLFDLKFLESFQIKCLAAGMEITTYLRENYKEFQEIYDRAMQTGEMPSFEVVEMWYQTYRKDMMERMK